MHRARVCAVVRPSISYKPLSKYAEEATAKTAQQQLTLRKGTALVPGTHEDPVPRRVVLDGSDPDPGAALMATITIEEKLADHRKYNPNLVDEGRVSKVSRKGYELEVKEQFMMSLRARTDPVLAAEADSIATQICEDYGIGYVQSPPCDGARLSFSPIILGAAH